MRLGGYDLVRRIAKGGMADIFLARRAGSAPAPHVAIKVLSPERAGDAEARALFRDEARLLAMLRHDNLARVYDVGRDYLAMEYVHGADLREVLAAAEHGGTAVPYETAVAIVAAAAAGLDHAHRRCGPDGRPLHLVHRDVSLSNIMVGHDGAVKVVDFGIATASVSAHHTNPGIVRGKASYMSPEQCLGDPVDLRTDVFALGVVLYELTTGRRCFHGNTDFERMLAVVQGEYAAPGEVVPGFPADLEAVIRGALALEPDQRFASAAALIDALARVAAEHGWALGRAPIARSMRALFGDVEVPRLPEIDPTIVTWLPRLARGTEGTDTVPDPLDDQPTRGRRSAPRLSWRPRMAA